jgi:hypothetical protein
LFENSNSPVLLENLYAALTPLADPVACGELPVAPPRKDQGCARMQDMGLENQVDSEVRPKVVDDRLDGQLVTRCLDNKLLWKLNPQATSPAWG